MGMDEWNLKKKNSLVVPHAFLKKNNGTIFFYQKDQEKKCVQINESFCLLVVTGAHFYSLLVTAVKVALGLKCQTLIYIEGVNEDTWRFKFRISSWVNFCHHLIKSMDLAQPAT